MARQLGFARVPPLVTRHVSRDEHLLTDYSCTEKSCWLWPVRGGWRARFAERARARGGGGWDRGGLRQAERDGHVGASEHDCSTAGQSQQLAERGPIPRENGCPPRSA